MLPYQHDTIDDILSTIDGLIIPGGDEDIHPKYYGQDFTSDRTKTNTERDDFEMLIIKKALELNIPFLGICRGMKLLNVVCGGTLIQDILNYLKDSTINHGQPVPKDILSHPIFIISVTILANLANKKEICMVNSTHHQAVDKN